MSEHFFEEGSRHLVVGFGKSGLSIVRALEALGVEEIWALDSRENPPNYDEINGIASKIVTGELSTLLLNSCDYLWLSPGISIKTPEIAEAIERLPYDRIGGDIELFARLVRHRLIGITGTNGKSTVTTLVGNILKEGGYQLYMGGNLGEPALELWLRSRQENPENPAYLLELSSFQLETTYNLNLDVGVLLNIAPDHLDRYESYNEYVDTKIHLFTMAKQWIAGYAIHERVTHFLYESEEEYETFALEQSGSDWQVDLATEEITHHGVPFLSYRGSRLGGLHNLLNIVAAVATSHAFGVEREAIERGVKSYEPLPHRTLLVEERGGVRYYNDSKSTNIASTVAALTGFPNQRKWLILGGVTKGQDFRELTPYLDEEIAGVLLIGEGAEFIAPAIPVDIPVKSLHQLEAAYRYLEGVVEPNDIVLFSPACASFDQYRSFEERGEHFEALVRGEEWKG